MPPAMSTTVSLSLSVDLPWLSFLPSRFRGQRLTAAKPERAEAREGPGLKKTQRSNKAPSTFQRTGNNGKRSAERLP